MFGTLFGAHGDLLSRSARVRRRNRLATPIAGEVLEQRVLLSLDSVGVDLRDFNGDGIEDVIEMQQDGEWWVGLSNGANSFATSIWADWADATAFIHVDFGDFNNDTRADIVGVDFGGNIWVGLSNGIDHFTTTLWGSGLGDTLAHVAVGDYDGDGDADLAGMNTLGEWRVALSTGVSAFQAATLWTDWADVSAWADIETGDFNNDGRTDIAGFAQGGRWWIGISNGLTNFTTGAAWAVWAGPSAWAEFEIGDFNGDGADDIAGFDLSGNWWIGRSNANVSSMTPTNTFSTDLWADWAPASNFAKVGVGDFDNDGVDDVIGIANGGRAWVGLSNADPMTGLPIGFVTSPTPWASWAGPATTVWAELELFNVGGGVTSGTDLVGLDQSGHWWVGVSNNTNLFVTDNFWADWDPASTFATLNGGLATELRLNQLAFE